MLSKVNKWYNSLPEVIRAKTIRNNYIDRNFDIKNNKIKPPLKDKNMPTGRVMFELPMERKNQAAFYELVKDEIEYDEIPIKSLDYLNKEAAIKYLNLSVEAFEQEINETKKVGDGTVRISELTCGKGFSLIDAIDYLSNDLNLSVKGVGIDILDHIKYPSIYFCGPNETKYGLLIKEMIKTEKASFRKSSIEDIPNDWMGFSNYIFSVQGLRYSIDPIRFIENVYSMLAPGGIARIHCDDLLLIRIGDQYYDLGASSGILDIWNKSNGKEFFFERCSSPPEEDDCVLVIKKSMDSNTFLSGLILQYDNNIENLSESTRSANEKNIDKFYYHYSSINANKDFEFIPILSDYKNCVPYLGDMRTLYENALPIKRRVSIVKAV